MATRQPVAELATARAGWWVACAAAQARRDGMIARIWRGWTAEDRADEYVETGRHVEVAWQRPETSRSRR